MALQIRRGLQADLPSSPADGELLFATDTGNFYVGVSGSPVLISVPKYLEVANVASVIANNTTKYLEVANAASAGTNTSISNVAFTSSNNNLKILTVDGRTFSIDLSGLSTDTSDYLEVANASIYMEVANVNARIANQTTKFLEVANAASVTPDGVSIYLEVANATALYTTKAYAASNTYVNTQDNAILANVNPRIISVVGTAATANTKAVQALADAAAANTRAEGARTIAATANTTASAALPKAGGTMTGKITLDGNPTNANHAANKAYVDAEVAGIVNSAPAALNTLNELAAALGDDENFATTVSTNLGQKLGATATVTLTGDVTAGATAFSSNAVSLSTTVAASVTSPYLEVANVTSSVHGAGFAANSYVVAQDNAILANVNPRIISVVGTAATANTKAVQALADAAAANTRAEGARTIAATANTKAVQALADAAAANTRAEGARTLAATANTRAGSALGVAATANTKAVQALTDAAAANTRAEGARTLAVNANSNLNAYKANTNPRFDSYLQVANVAAKVANLTTQFLEVANVVAVIANNTTKYLTVANSAVFQQAGDAATTYLPLTGGQLSGNLRIDSIGGSSGVHVTNGAIEIFTATGSPAYIDFYCETNNAHRARLKSPAHGDYSGDVDITLPTTTGTVALTSQLTQYLQVANVVATISNNTTKYLEVANAASAGTNTSISNVAFTSSNSNLKILTADSRTFSIDLSGLAGDSANINADSVIGAGDGSTTTFTSPLNTTDENQVIVTVDGVMQRPQTDYTISGTTVTFGSPPLNGTAVMVRTAAVSPAANSRYLEVANATFLPLTGGTLSANLKISSASNDAMLTIESTNPGTVAAPVIDLYKNSASPADGDYLGQLKFQGESDSGAKRVYAKLTGKTSDVSDGTEDGLFEISVRSGGSNKITNRLTGSETQTLNGTVFTENGNRLASNTYVQRYITVANASALYTTKAYAAANSYVNAREDAIFANVNPRIISVVSTAATANTTASAALPKAGGTMSGAIAMGTSKITGMGDPTADQDAATKAYVDTEVAAIVDSAPGTLNTLNELAAALNDDANFASTVTTNLGQKLGATATVTLTGDVTATATAFSSNAVSLSTTVASSVTSPYLQVANSVPVGGGTFTGDVEFSGEALLGSYKETKATASTSSSTLAVSLNSSMNHVVTLNNNITSFSFTNLPASSSQVMGVSLILIQGTGGSKTITWPASYKFQGGTEPTLSTAEGDIDVLTFFSYDGGSTWLVTVAGLDFS